LLGLNATGEIAGRHVKRSGNLRDGPGIR
jgi:hypothetical protein